MRKIITYCRKTVLSVSKHRFWYKLLGYTIKDLNIVKIQEITAELVISYIINVIFLTKIKNINKLKRIFSNIKFTFRT